MSLFVPKEWKDRLAEFAGRRKLTNVSTGEETTVDVSRAEGEVSQAGDAFSAANMNDLEQRIKDGFDKVDTNLTADGTPFRFGKDADGNYGYIITDEAGADSVIPFNNIFCGFLESGESFSSSAATVNAQSKVRIQSGVPYKVYQNIIINIKDCGYKTLTISRHENNRNIRVTLTLVYKDGSVKDYNGDNTGINITDVLFLFGSSTGDYSILTFSK